jgi:glycosyltransferase involved in cell wall biosynthesis
MPFFSIVIPLYNKENYISATLNSVFSQTFTDFEIIVVDDASTDHSKAIVQKSKSRGLQIVEHSQNNGLSASRNTGIKNSTANFIAFLDADDTWEPFFLEKMHQMISRFPQAGIFGAGYTEYYSENLSVLPKTNLQNNENMLLIPDFFLAASHQPLYCFSSVVLRKEVFDSVGYFDEDINFGEDIDFNLRANSKFELAYYNRSCCNYIIFSENQITNSSIIGKRLTDFDRYEPLALLKPSVKLYVDINRYMAAMHFKFSGDLANFQKMREKIKSGNLTLSQKIMLSSPLFLSKIIRKIKLWFLGKGIRLTTFKDATRQGT